MHFSSRYRRATLAPADAHGVIVIEPCRSSYSSARKALLRSFLRNRAPELTLSARSISPAYFATRASNRSPASANRQPAAGQTLTDSLSSPGDSRQERHCASLSSIRTNSEHACNSSSATPGSSNSGRYHPAPNILSVHICVAPSFVCLPASFLPSFCLA